MEAGTTETYESHEQLAANDVKLSVLCTMNDRLTDELSHVGAQNVTGSTGSDDLKAFADNCERLSKRGKVARSCANISCTPSTAAFLAMLAEQKDYQNRFEALSLENQCIPGLAAVAKKFCKKLAERVKADTLSKTTPKRQKKRAPAADKR